MSDRELRDSADSMDIAVIGMACRFPGANNVDEFWRNLRDGVESITSFTDQQLEAMGVPAQALRDPNFVKAGAILNDIELFDTAFFGYSPKEAELIDPQHRIFLECAWHALENAGYGLAKLDGLVGVYAGTSLSTYLLYNLLSSPAYMNAEDSFQVMIGNDKDFLSTRISYELDLKGPSIDVQTGCSTSLVATHLACQGLLSYQCDMALAGGVSVQVPQRTGYYYQPAGINSPDGHCRAFDAEAGGTIFGSGVGIVILKRLADALTDEDCIHAIIKGSSINNDGSAKIGYTAPSVDGQAQVIAMAQVVAGVEPETITYIETHGTGTALGDPVEVLALTNVFRNYTRKVGFCAIGSVKTNIGHLDAAAGVAGLIKTVLALKHKQIPPSLHFQNPNPKIDFEHSPFYVSAKLSEWKNHDSPRRAGVSSFGIGGTNAHVIVEEAPWVNPTGESRPWQLLVISAKTGAALEAATLNLTDHLKRYPGVNLADVAYTLQVGRQPFKHARLLVCRDVDDGVAALQSRNPQRVLSFTKGANTPSVVFMFPGGGAQHINMALDLYRHEAAFRKEIDSSAEILKPALGYDLRPFIYPKEGQAEDLAKQMSRTSTALPALFLIEYALAKLWMTWGVRPKAMIGHSLGEYVAACLAGVFSLEDALSLVVLRGRLFEQLPCGAMLSVPLPEDKLRPLLKGNLSIAAVNAPDQCVVSGPVAPIESMARWLTEQEIEFRRLHIDVAAHSEMVTPLLQPFGDFLEGLDLQPPGIPYISNVTGTWIRDEEATDPHYYVRHLRHTVRFSEGIQELLKESSRALLEVGPGQTLSTLARSHVANSPSHFVVSSMRHPYDRQSDYAFLLSALGKLHLAGERVEWAGFYANEQRRRVPLPTYPFEGKRYWIEPNKNPVMRAGLQPLGGKTPDISDWFYIPSWKRSMPPTPLVQKNESTGEQKWLVFDDGVIGSTLVGRLRQHGHETISVRAGERFARASDGSFSINPASGADYRELLKELECANQLPSEIVHLWSLAPHDDNPSFEESFEAIQEYGFYSLLFLAQALGECNITEPIKLWAVTSDTLEVSHHDAVQPPKATLLGPCKVIQQEYENITCRCIDVTVPRDDSAEMNFLADQLMAEITANLSDPVIAYRGEQRWVQTFEPEKLDAVADSECLLRKNGVYLITGGLGGIGLSLARYLAQTVGARLALTARSSFPEKHEWDARLAADGDGELGRKISKLQALEEMGAEVLILRADVASEDQMRSAVSQIGERFGTLNGIIHAAGLAGEKAIKLVGELERSECQKHFRAKVLGSSVLEKVLRGTKLDFCLLFSSNASILGGLGSTAYAAANLFLDSFASVCNRSRATRWISANWDGWLLEDEIKLNQSFQTSLDQYAMTQAESTEVFKRIVSNVSVPQIVISTGDLPHRLNLWVMKGDPQQSAEPGEPGAALHSRPDLGIDYVPPTNQLEQTVTHIWQELLGIDRLGIHDNFFDLGGNSLIGLKVVSRLKRELDVDIPIVTLFEGPTVSAFSKLISQNGSARPSYESSQSRGERRREKRLRKQSIAEGA
jgi:phthiocerol/phenolphthiocerol synthesis type-I polyketide synthase E